MIFIGSGPAGYVGAIKAAQLGLKTACVEKTESLGGTCLNVGCIPSKALLHASELAYHIQTEAKEVGIDIPKYEINFSQMMKHKEKAIEKLTKGIAYLFKKNKVELIQGQATFVDRNTIEVSGARYTAKNFVIATGSFATPLPFLPFDEEKVLSSTGALNLKTIPKKLLIIGAGVIGLELGSVYRRLGSEVEVIELLDRAIPEFDEDLSKQFQKTLEKQGFTFHFGAKVTGGQKGEKGVTIDAELKGEKKVFSGDKVLISIGRRPFTDHLGLDKAGVAKDSRGFITIDGEFKTTNPHIYAIGDVAGPPMLAHKGSEEAIAVAEKLAGKMPHKIQMLAIPNVIYTYPEVASVGFTENQLKEKNIPYLTANFPFLGNSRYMANGGSDPCFIKTLAHKETKHLLGVHILSPNASELIAQPTLAIHNKLTLHDLASTCFAHPTLSEALHEAYLGLDSHFLHI